MSHVANMFRERRLTLGLTTGELAKLLGYKGNSISKGVNRLNDFEASGQLHHNLFVKLVEVLVIPLEKLTIALEADYREWAAWADEPIEPQLVLRAMACVYPHLHIPERIKTQDDLKRYAAAVARKYRKKVSLTASRKQTFIFDEQGEIEDVIEAKPFASLEPTMRIGGRRFQLQCTDDTVRIKEYRKHDCQEAG